MLLDDLQKEMELMEIGVPDSSKEDGCKIVFTTRSVEVVYRQKRVNASVEVKCLPPDDAWDLFQKTVGRHTLRSHPDIPALARIVAKKCHGVCPLLSGWSARPCHAEGQYKSGIKQFIF